MEVQGPLQPLPATPRSRLRREAIREPCLKKEQWLKSSPFTSERLVGLVDYKGVSQRRPSGGVHHQRGHAQEILFVLLVGPLILQLSRGLIN